MRYVDGSVTVYYGAKADATEFIDLLQSAAMQAHDAVRARRDAQGLRGTMATTLTLAHVLSSAIGSNKTMPVVTRLDAERQAGGPATIAGGARWWGQRQRHDHHRAHHAQAAGVTRKASCDQRTDLSHDPPALHAIACDSPDSSPCCCSAGVYLPPSHPCQPPRLRPPRRAMYSPSR